MSANPLTTHTPSKPGPKIQTKPNNLINYKPVNLNPSPNKPAMIAARPLAPLLPATAQPVPISTKPTVNPVKKPKNENLLIQQPKIQQQTTLTQDQFNQLLQQKSLAPAHSSINPLANGNFYQFIPIQSNGLKLQQPLIIAPVQPQMLPQPKNSTIQPKPQNPIIHTTPDGQISQIIFQTVSNNKPINPNPSQPPVNPASSAVTQPVQHQLNTTTNNIQLLQQRLAEEEQRQDQLLKQLNEKKKLQKKSPEKKTKNDEMEIEESHEGEKIEEHNNTNGSVHNKKRGRPRLYEVDASTGKSIKGKLLNNVKQKPAKMVLQPQIQLTNGFTLYPSPSTSSSSSYSQQNFIINPPGQIVNPQFIPLNIVQPMVQEEKTEETEEEEENEDIGDKVEENSEKENCELMVPKIHTPQPQNHSHSHLQPLPEPISEPEPKKITDTLKNLKSQVVLTHVIDGFVIKESTKPFPVKPVEPEHAPQQSPPKSTSTPSNNKKREDDLSERLNNSRLDDQSLLNTSNSSQKSKGKSLSNNKSPKKIKKTTHESPEKVIQAQNFSFQNTSPQFNSTMACNKEEWPSGDPSEWNCDDVYRFVWQVAGQQVAEMFKSQEVDGSALSLIRDDHLVNTMGVKLGPALKIMSKFNELKNKFTQ